MKKGVESPRLWQSLCAWLLAAVLAVGTVAGLSSSAFAASEYTEFDDGDTRMFFEDSKNIAIPADAGSAGAGSVGGLSGEYYIFGAYAAPQGSGFDSDVPVFCIEMELVAPSADGYASVAWLGSAKDMGQPAELTVTTAQMAWLLDKYQLSGDNELLAALAMLVHANFEQGSDAEAIVADMAAQVKKHAPNFYNRVLELVDEAQASGVKNYVAGEGVVETPQTGEVKNIGIQNADGEWVAGRAVTVTMDGPAVFTETGTNTWSGTTQSTPITLEWEATGSGEVTFKSDFEASSEELKVLAADGGLQDTIQRPKSTDPTFETVPGNTWMVGYDFQPVGTSNVVTREVNTDGTISDVLTTGVDESYGSGSWLEIDGTPVTVKYRATAYWAGRTVPAESDSVPEGAEKIGSVLVDANGAGQALEAELSTSKRGYVTWVWEVLQADQGENATHIHADWSDAYGLAAETSLENFTFRPMGVSHVGDSKVVSAQCERSAAGVLGECADVTISDSFTAAADSSFRDGEWTRLVDAGGSFDEGAYVPVTYRATAYLHSASVLPTTEAAVPEGVEELGSVLVTAQGPSTVEASLTVSGDKAGFVTWVWEVDEADQDQDMLKWIEPGWVDQYGLADETTSIRAQLKLSSKLAASVQSDGTHLVDALNVEGLPENHSDFVGGSGFDADVATIEHQLLFFEDGLEVSEANKAQAQVIGETVSTPAENGSYTDVSDASWVVLRDADGFELPGVYVVVSTFAGDDRVEAYTSPVTDVNEQFTVEKRTVKTTATDKADGDKLVPAVADAVVQDVVAYTGLTVGQEYTMSGILMDKATGEPVVVDGEEVVASKTFTPTESSGEVVIEFTVDGSLLAGKTVVAFETVYLDGKAAAVHADINDEAQTVVFPSVKTTATDEADGDKSVPAMADAVVVDRVCYTGLAVGTTYTLEGTLMDKATGEPVMVDGEPYVKTVAVAPTNSDDCFDMFFPVDGSGLAGHETVVFERILDGDTVMVAHMDLEDEGQTVVFPSVKTTATDKADGDKLVASTPDQVVQDVVAYTGLAVGQEYTMSGTLMDKATGEPLVVDGEEVVASQTFTPTESFGEVVIEFTVDGSLLAGKTVVAFETVSQDGVDIAVHADIDDDSQTVYFPKVSTTATDKADGDHVVVAVDNAVVVDKVCYENLVAGESYTVEGSLMIQATGEPVVVNGKPVVASETFVADAASGCVDVEFTFDASSMVGISTVVFEDLIFNDVTVATHADLEDEGQTVSFEADADSDLASTGSNVALVAGAALVLLIAGVWTTVSMRRRMQLSDK